MTHYVPLCLGKFSLLRGGSEGKGRGPAPASPEAAEPGNPESLKQGAREGAARLLAVLTLHRQDGGGGRVSEGREEEAGD